MKVLKILSLLFVILLVLVFFALHEGDIPKDVIDARYASPASQFLDMGDAGRIHYRDQGNRRNPALVLLHGSNASLHTWEPWVERLITGYRVISLDFPGHGLTGEVISDDYSHDAYLAIVDGVTAHLGVESFVLAGNSMGGSVAWRFALAYPDKLNGLVLIDSGAPSSWHQKDSPHYDGSDDGGDNRVQVFELLRQPWFRAFATRLDPYYATVQGVKAAYNNSAVIDDTLIMRYYDLNLRQGTRRATMIRFSYNDTDEEADLTAINVPTLIMWGKEDVLTPFKHAKEFELVIADTQTAYYENVGHVPMEEIPEQSANDLTMFLTSLLSGEQDNAKIPEQAE